MFACCFLLLLSLLQHTDLYFQTLSYITLRITLCMTMCMAMCMTMCMTMCIAMCMTMCIGTFFFKTSWLQITKCVIISTAYITDLNKSRARVLSANQNARNFFHFFFIPSRTIRAPNSSTFYDTQPTLTTHLQCQQLRPKRLRLGTCGLTQTVALLFSCASKTSKTCSESSPNSTHIRLKAMSTSRCDSRTTSGST